MQLVLVDTSVWIDYFRGGRYAAALDTLIDDNLLVTNDLILAELLPYLQVRRQRKVVALLQAINRVALEIDWADIINMQVKCLRDGSNGVGIPDLVIVQNARLHGCAIFSIDKHFQRIRRVCSGFELLH
jgi:predicted nucleic acid-binding protein